MLQTPLNNRILSVLSREELDACVPYLQPVDLKHKQVLCDIGEPFDYIYFLEQGLASVIKTMEDGSSVEVGMLGYEGFTPVPALLGADISEQHIVMQLPGNGYRIRVSDCRDLFETQSGFRQITLNFINSFMNFSAQTAACNRLHDLEQRLSRWLLASQDRFRQPVLPLTQEYLAIMLGVRRSGVNEAAGRLQDQGLIDYTHGRITLINRDGLEKAACECYALDYKRFKEL